MFTSHMNNVTLGIIRATQLCMIQTAYRDQSSVDIKLRLFSLLKIMDFSVAIKYS